MWANSISGLKSPKALNIYLKKILPFNEKNWRWTLRKYSVLIWECPVLASDQCMLEIPSETSELRTLLLSPVAWCCCMSGSVSSTAMVTQGLTGTRGGHHQPSFGAAPSCPGLPCQARGAFQGGARAQQGPSAHGSAWRPTLPVGDKGCSSLPNRIRNAN